MEPWIIVIVVCFVVLLFATMIAMLIRTIGDIKFNKYNRDKKNKTEYVIEVLEGGEIKLRKINRGGGISYKQY